MRRAVIDVGTNSVKLLVADVSGHQVTPIIEDSRQSRLGRGFYENSRLQPGPIEQTARVVAEFSEICREQKVQSLRVIATSAARDAVNSRDLIEAIGHASGLGVEIISGEQEADLAYKGVTSDPELAKHPLLLLDVGGGSTEFILGHGAQIDFKHSFPIGAVRLMERLPSTDPPGSDELENCRAWLKHLLNEEVRPRLEPELQSELRHGGRDGVLLVGTGGTTTILARMQAKLENYDREQIEAVRLNIEQVTAQLETLWSLPLDKRKKLPGLPPERADVILTGTAIYETVMLEFGFTELRVSTRGLRFAAVIAG